MRRAFPCDLQVHVVVFEDVLIEDSDEEVLFDPFLLGWFVADQCLLVSFEVVTGSSSSISSARF